MRLFLTPIKLKIIDYEKANRCKSIRKMPTIDKLADKYEDQMEIVKVNVDEFQGLAQEFGVRSIPALFVLNNGEIDHALKGFQTEQTLEEIIQSYGVIA